MIPLLAGLLALMAGLLAWLAYELIGIRQQLHELPLGDDELYGMVRRLDEGLGADQVSLAELADRVAVLESGLPKALQRVGSVSYDAYGDVAGNLSRSIAFLNDEGSGVVISQLVSRTESRLFAKGVRDGRGEEPLSPEERAAVQKALQA